MDDILIHTPNDPETHRKRVHQVLTKLKHHDLYLKPEKCQFKQKQVEFLGVILSAGTVQLDPTKIKGIADWPPPKNVRDVQAFLGFTGFYRYFVPNYSRIACPLIELTKKTTPFHWKEPQIKAFKTLKTLMCARPILRQPDYTKPFFLAMDASAYSVGAVLSQEGETNPRTHKIMRHPIAYYSATFTPTERNYDIFERELLAVMKALHHWRPHLAATETPVTVLTDHTNLNHWKMPKKVNRRVAQWFGELQEYNLVIQHVPGKLHTAADMLSRPPVEDKGEGDNNDLTLLPEKMFIRLQTSEDTDPTDQTLEHKIAQVQRLQSEEMKAWTKKHKLTYCPQPRSLAKPQWLKGTTPVIPDDPETRKELMDHFHNAPTAGHPGRDETIQAIKRRYWWPNMNTWIEEYVKGCTPCQQNKNLTHRKNTPLYRISPHPKANPFEEVAMDLITQLPKNGPYDAILTIVDHGCTRAALFLPCTTTITGEGIAKLYLCNVYQWFGIPKKIITDQDPRFTSHFTMALCQKLKTKQNISTAYHPQTDRLSERKNQWVEQYLQFVTTAQQDDWSDWLPIASLVHNTQINATIKIAPIQALIGYLPETTPSHTPLSTNQRVEERGEEIGK
jgi:hypothetical protein